MVDFYVRLLSDPEVRNRIDTPEKCDELCEEMEQCIDHGDLPPCYLWLIRKRDRLLAQ